LRDSACEGHRAESLRGYLPGAAVRFEVLSLCQRDDKHRKVVMNISATITVIAKRVTFLAAAALRLSLFSDGATL